MRDVSIALAQLSTVALQHKKTPSLRVFFLETVVEHLLHGWIHVVFCLLSVFHHVDMDGFVVVGIEFEDIAKQDKNGWD